MVRITLAIAATVLVSASTGVSAAPGLIPAAAQGFAPEPEIARRCRLINIGTPSNPRLVKDPGCRAALGR